MIRAALISLALLAQPALALDFATPEYQTAQSASPGLPPIRVSRHI